MTAPRDTTPRSGTDFDQAMRALHAQGLAHVPARTLSRLRIDRHATRARGTGPRSRWMPGMAFAAVFACALGIAWLQSPPSANAPRVAQGPAVAPAASQDGLVVALEAAEAEMMLDPLDEDPDLYLWLAANDETLPSILER